MLQPMRPPAPSPSSTSPSSFAGLLATLASPSPSPPSDADDDTPLWSGSDLGEDVATLTYERALRTHARYRPENRNLDRDSDWANQSPMPTGESGNGARADASIELNAAGATDAIVALDASAAAVVADVAPNSRTGTARENDLRSASVTIRLSRTECARLHQRAAEAGLTVSAYLRSCAVEAESLRAQVKQALAELKAGTEGPSHSSGQKTPTEGAGRKQGNKRSARRSFFAWIGWLTGRGR
jgi:hypothetical protein